MMVVEGQVPELLSLDPVFELTRRRVTKALNAWGLGDSGDKTDNNLFILLKSRIVHSYAPG